jgi:peptidoglycan/LPS O-acetylase OafA/YrhL
MNLGQVLDSRNNALNAWRITLAIGVILCHTFPLTGREVSNPAVHQLLANVWVDGFFAMSGFLITSSWLNNPRTRDYFVARCLRILPGLWFCLIVTAFVIAPIGVAIQGGSAAKLLLSPAPILYVLKNSAVAWLQPDIAGTPNGVPWAHGWDGSLWTLLWEVLCYIAIFGLGIFGLLKRRWPIVVAMALALACAALLPPQSAFEVDAGAATQQQAVDGATALTLVGVVAARFAVMFLAGALLYQFRSVIPARWWMVAVSFCVVLATALLPDYRLVGAIPLAYAIIVSGALIHNKRLRLRTDLSYGVYIYAFPVQQLLVICGLGMLNPFLFALIATIATLPLAALSWFAIEKPALSLRSRLKRKAPPGEEAPAEVGDVAVGPLIPVEGHRGAAGSRGD